MENGTSSTLFAACLVLALIVMYDATGVRLHAGRQATVLNIIIAEMPPDHPVQVGQGGGEMGGVVITSPNLTKLS